nr:MAG: hypothetical protein [Penaeus semisulcatus pemonivirus]
MNLNKSDSERELVSSVTSVASALYNRRCPSNVGSSEKLPQHKTLTKFVFDNTRGDDYKIPIEQKFNKDNMSIVEDGLAELTTNRPDGTEITSVASESTVSAGLDQLNDSHRSESGLLNHSGKIDCIVDGENNETLKESSRVGVKLDVDRHVRSRRTFVPGPDELNGLLEPPFDKFYISSDYGEITHPLDLIKPVTNKLLDG